MLIFLSVLLLVIGCQHKPATLLVGAKAFPEQKLVCEIVTQYLRLQTRAKVECVTIKGTTQDVHRELVDGKIDLYVEYVGTALTELLNERVVPQDAAIAWTTVEAEYKERWQLQWVARLGFEDSHVLVIRTEDANPLNIATLSDAVAKRETQGWALGVGSEFLYREDGLENLLKRYPLPLNRPVETMDPDQLYKALSEKRVDMVVGNSTDGILSILAGTGPKQVFTVLVDDQHFFPPYSAGIVVRSKALQEYPSLQVALTKLEGAISNAEISCMNEEVIKLKTTADKQEDAERVVASWFLRAKFNLNDGDKENSSTSMDCTVVRARDRSHLAAYLLPKS
jgi:glycine betaine/choline ABC-type transport system substrate-binding protein